VKPSKPLIKDPTDNLVIIGGWNEAFRLSDIEAVSIDEDGINCDPTDLPYKVSSHASVYSSVLEAIVTCGGYGNWNYLSKCILQTKRNESNQFPSLISKRLGLSLTAISNKIFAIGGSPNKNTMETINLNTADRQWKKEELPFSVWRHCSVGLGNKIIVTGGDTRNGYSNYIFGLRRRDMTWIKMNKTMKIGRYSHSLLNIPAKQVLGC